MATSDGEYRIEHDTMGEVRVAAAAKWAAQTQRAVDNFPISGLTIDRALIAALAAIKGAAAEENARLKTVPRNVANAIAEAAREIADGRWDDQFPVDVYQTGSGTSSNMNTSQSSNDVFPSAIHVAAAQQISVELIPALEHLARSLRKKQRAFRTVVK